MSSSIAVIRSSSAYPHNFFLHDRYSVFFLLLGTSVPDLEPNPDPDPPDPHVFGPPGSGSISQRYGSGSLYQQAKIVRKILIPTVLWLLLDFLSFKKDVNIPSKSNKKKNLLLASWRSMTKIAGSRSGSICQRHGSADPDPDTHENVMDPEHYWEQWLLRRKQTKPSEISKSLKKCTMVLSIAIHTWGRPTWNMGSFRRLSAIKASQAFQSHSML